MNKPYFKLFSNCIPVRGAYHAVICDLQRSRYRLIPTLLYDILYERPNEKVENIKAAYNYLYDAGIDGFFSLLVEEGLGFFTDEPEAFPPLDMQWHHPSVITNSIIDTTAQSNHDFKKIFGELDGLACEAVQLRFFTPVSIAFLDEILIHIITSRIRTIELLLPYSEEYSEENITQFQMRHLRIRSLIIHSAPETVKGKYKKEVAFYYEYTSQVIDSHHHCGNISKEYFNINIQQFTEAQHYNSCLNRKISIDENGFIKNCPSMVKSFGHINDVSLKDVLNIEEFKSLWSIQRDSVSKCKDCEFRYICTDCRAFIKDADNIYSEPLKCSYDPYVGKWEHEKAKEAVA